MYGSRHLTYDIPFPIDECNNDDIEIRRRPSKRERRLHGNSAVLFGKGGMMHDKGVFRTNSLEIHGNEVERSPVVRNVSSPIGMQYANPHK